MNATRWRKLVSRRYAADAKSHGRPVGKPHRHPILRERARERFAGNRLYDRLRKRKTAPVSETGFLSAIALRSNEVRAGRKSAASGQATRN